MNSSRQIVIMRRINVIFYSKFTCDEFKMFKEIIE